MEATKNTVAAGEVVVRSVPGSEDIRLTVPLTLKTPISPFTLCRLCLVRLPISPVEKLILEFVISIAEAKLADRYSYDDLGKIIGRCTHSVKKAVAALRKLGLLVSSRTAYSGPTLSFSCGRLVVWAVDLLSRSGLLACAGGHVPEGFNDPKPDDEEQPKEPNKKRKARKPAAKKENIVFDLAEHPAVAAAGQHYTMSRADDPDASGIQAGCCASAMRDSDDDETVDNSEELAGTLKAAGRETCEDDDDFSFGAETAETDIGHGVKMNPDL